MLTRRAFNTTMALAPFCVARAKADSGWIELFDGKTLDAWRAAENPATWNVVDGLLVHDGPRSHIFYNGLVGNAMFRNFELEVEAMSAPNCNSGLNAPGQSAL